MMKRLLLYGLAFASICTIFTSCMPKDELVYAGPDVVEFKNNLLSRVAARQPAGVTLNAVLSRTASVNTRGTDTIYVNLIGPQKSTATDINFSIGAGSTAIAGTHFNFRSTNATKVTIPANSSTGFLLVDMVPGSITGSATFPLVLTLTGNGDIKPSENYKTFTLTLRN